MNQTKTKRPKQAICHQFTHKERKATLTQFHFNPEVVLLDTGIHQVIDFSDGNFKSNASRISKNLRTFLHTECLARGWNYDDVIVDISLPTTTKGVKRSFAGLTIMFPCAGSELKDNESFAKQLIDQFYMELERIAPDEGKP